MPRALSKSKVEDFEPRKKNPIGLLDDSFLDSHLKSLKIGDKVSPLQLSDSEFKIEGDLFIGGKLTSHVLETENQYFDIKMASDGSFGYVRFIPEGLDSARDSLKMYFDSLGGMYTYSDGDIYQYARANFIWSVHGGGSSVVTAQLEAGGKFTLNDGDDTGDKFEIDVGTAGVTTLATTDDDGTGADLTLDPDGDLIISGADTKIDATQKLYLDGGGDTYIKEGIADRLDIYVGGTNIVRIIEGVANYIYINGDIAVEAGEKLIFDSAIGGHTHIRESADDELDITVGDDIMLHLDENGADGNQAHFVNASVGFTQLEPTYNAASTTVDFRHSNKQNLTFGSGNIGHMNFYFPEMSGNFVLLIKQDGTGSRTVTGAWRVYEFDESTADGATEVVWAGGSAPTLTTDANHVDILSFYWDADNEIAYGVATLDFQF